MAQMREFRRISFRVTELKHRAPGFARLARMSKTQVHPTAEREAVFYERRRLRRVRMIVDLTLNLIRRDPSLSHREARCLVSCARKAILELYPNIELRFETLVQPQFEQVLRRRWPSEELLVNYEDSTVN